MPKKALALHTLLRLGLQINAFRGYNEMWNSDLGFEVLRLGGSGSRLCCCHARSSCAQLEKSSYIIVWHVYGSFPK